MATMIKTVKRCIAGLLALLLVIGAMSADIPKGSASTKAAENEPKYMAKMVHTSDETKDRLGQYIQVQAGKTYTLSYKMYVIEKGNLQAWVNEESCIIQGNDDVSGNAISKTTTYEIPADKTNIYLNFQTVGGQFYIWDIEFTAEGSNENLLKNADFTEGEGSFVNWCYSGWGGSNLTEVTMNAVSDAFAQATGRKVIQYNSQLFSTNVTNREEMETAGDRKYMAKIQSGAAGYWIYQTISAEIGATYHFTCDYYVERMGSDDIGHMAMWNTPAKEQNFEASKKGSMDVSFQTNEDWLGARFYIASNMTIYISNVRLVKEGSSENLLKNSDFSQEGGTWIGWTVNNSAVADKAASTALKASCGAEIVLLDTNMFPQKNTPSYMAKIETAVESNWFWILQGTAATAGKTYTFACDYYVADGLCGNICIWSGSAEVSKAFDMGEKKHVEVSVTVPEEQSGVSVRFEIPNGTKMFLWNVSLIENGTQTNLLTNGNFEQESGSWIGWRIKDETITDKTASDAAKDTYGTSIVTYDESLFSKQDGTDNPGTPNVPDTPAKPDTPEAIPTGEPKHMAKIELQSDANWLWVYQTLSIEAGKTYHFTCDYYVKEGEGANAVVWSNDNDAKSIPFKRGSQNSLDVKYQAGANVTGIAARFEIVPGSTIYIWNVCLAEEGGEVNLLTNGSFKKESGSFIGWSVGQSGTIGNKEASDKLKAEYGAEIIKYDSGIFPQPEVPEGIPSGEPEYMAKIQLKSDAKWLWVYQSVATEENTTYHFTCNYYVKEGEGGNAVVWSSDLDAVQSPLKPDTRGTIDITYKAGKDVTGFSARFEIAPGSTIYIWNVCLRENNGKVNLLTNGSFKKENGSLVGWSVGQSGMIKDKVTSDKMKSEYGVEILKYDSDIFPQPEAAEGIPSGDPKYMAHLIGSHKDPTGKMHTYVNVRQGITPEAGKTYVFSCNYYDTKQDSATASILLWSDTSKGSEGDSYGRFRATTKAGTEGRLEITYTATEGDTYIAVSMECEPDSEVYMWNLCLNERGKTENLLKNGSFSKGEGSWIGWSIGENTAKTIEDSNQFVSNYGHKIEAFNRAEIDELKAEDAALLSYVNPNVVFSFDDAEKYKEMDLKYVKTASAETDNTKADDTKEANNVNVMMIVWISTAVVLTGGLGATGVVLAVKKKKLTASKK